MPLPRFIVLQSNSNNRYLRYKHEYDESPHAHMFLQFSGEDIFSTYVKFEVVLSQTPGQLVHLKCCYNNKYWACHDENYWVAAKAANAEEDSTKRSCTLFRPTYVDPAANTIRFLHVNLRRYVCLWSILPAYDSCLYLNSETPNHLHDVFKVVDWNSLFRMPKYVAFKGHNKNYVGAREIDNHNYLQISYTDKNDPEVVNEIFTTLDGNISIKSIYFDRFWRQSTRRKNILGIDVPFRRSWIWADSNDANNQKKDTLFWPVRVNENTVALRNLGNNKFCKGLGKRSCLSADDTAVSRSSQLEVEELVFERNIYDVKYCLRDARISDQGNILVGKGRSFNRTNEVSSLEVKLSYKDIKSSTWKTSGSLKLGVKVGVEIGTLPKLIVGGKIETLPEVQAGIEFGKTMTVEKLIEVTYKVPVPAKHEVIVNAIAKVATIDVPFSYSQRDIVYNGDACIEEKDDGMYTGVDYFEFIFEHVFEKLPDQGNPN